MSFSATTDRRRGLDRDFSNYSNYSLRGTRLPRLDARRATGTVRICKRLARPQTRWAVSVIQVEYPFVRFRRSRVFIVPETKRRGAPPIDFARCLDRVAREIARARASASEQLSF